MGLFKRDVPTSTADAGLPLFKSTEADALRSLVAQAFAQRGTPVTVFPDHVADATGRTFGLGNLAAQAAGLDASAWQELVHAHVGSVLNPMNVADLAQDEFEQRLRVRLMEQAQLPGEGFGYARAFTHGLVEVLVADLPDTVALLPESELLSRGDLAGLLDLGRRNLRSTLDQTQSITLPPDAIERVTIVLGNEFFAASLALVLPEVIHRLSGESDRGHGIFVAVPSRAKLAYRVVDGPDAMGSFFKLVDLAMRGYYQDPAPVSPLVFWVRDGVWCPATEVDSNGVPTVIARPQLEAEWSQAGWT